MNFGGDYKNSAASGGVMMMIEGVIRDAKDLEKEAQSAYETLITDGNNVVAAKKKEVAEKTEEMAAKDEENVNSKGSLGATDADLQSLAGIASALHQDCDFLVNNWDIRNEARDQEIDALKTTLAMLSGADFR